MRIFIFIGVLFSLSFSINKAVKPYTFTPHTTANPNYVNANFDSLKNPFNNSVDTMNIAIPRTSTMFRYLKSGDTLIDTAKITKAVIDTTYSRATKTKKGTIDTVNSDSIKTRVLDIAGVSPSTFNISGFSNNNNSHGYLSFNASKSGVLNSLTATTDLTIFGIINGNGANTSDAQATGTRIWFSQDGAGGATYIPGAIRFLTGTNAAAPTERMRISNDGVVRFSKDIFDTGTIAASSFLGNYIQFGTTANSKCSTYVDTIGADSLFENTTLRGTGKFRVTQIGSAITVSLSSISGTIASGSTIAYVQGIPYKYLQGYGRYVPCMVLSAGNVVSGMIYLVSGTVRIQLVNSPYLGNGTGGLQAEVTFPLHSTSSAW